MTPLQAVRARCSNYQLDGSCLGIGFGGNSSMYHFRKEGLPCLLCSGERCSYFEEIIVPIRAERPAEVVFRRTQGRSGQAIAAGACADSCLPQRRVISLLPVAPPVSAQ